MGAGLVVPTPTALCDLTGSTPVTVTSAYDTADRVTGAGYSYDTLARTTALPAGAVSGGSPLTVGYATNDMVATLTQAGRTRTYTLDPARRVLTTADTTGPTLTNHYTTGEDNPAWISSSDGTWTRYVNAPAGGLALTVDNTGTVALNLANLHGDIVATAAVTDTGPATYAETTEYGLPRDPAGANRRYGWLGTYQRNTGDTLAQLTLMGVRLYNPTTGRFLTTDPIPGGNANDYDYCTADPVNCTDLDGRFGWRKWIRRAAIVAGVVGALACGASIVCGVAVGAAAAAGAYSARNAFSNRWRWSGLGRASFKGAASGLAWGGAARTAGWRLGNRWKFGVRFSRGGGRGTDFLWRGSRKFAIHSHRIGRWPVTIHYHRRPGIGLHRPWQRGF